MTLRHLHLLIYPTHIPLPLQVSHHYLASVLPCKGVWRYVEQASGSDLSQDGRPGVLSGCHGQVAFMTSHHVLQVSHPPDSPISSHNQDPFPRMRARRSPHSCGRILSVAAEAADAHLANVQSSSYSRRWASPSSRKSRAACPEEGQTKGDEGHNQS